jgi:hypothetical protein
MKLCDLCGPNDNCSLTCSHNLVIAVDDRHKENTTGINDELNKILMEKDIEFTLDRTNQSEKNCEINNWNNQVSSSLPSTNNNNSNQSIPDYKRLHTTKVPGIITEDNFMLLVQTSYPPEKRIFRSSVDNETSSSSNSSTEMGQQNNERPKQSSKSHKIISTKLFQLPPSMSPQPRTSPPPGVRRTSFATRSKTSSSESGGSSGYGSSSSSYSNILSEPSSTVSRDNSYLLKNNTLLQLSQSNNTNPKCFQYDEVQDMELDSLSSDSSDPSPFINIDADEDEVMEVNDNENNKRRKNRVEESALGMNLRLQDAAIEERRKLADKAAPQEQRTMVSKCFQFYVLNINVDQEGIKIIMLIFL